VLIADEGLKRHQSSVTPAESLLVMFADFEERGVPYKVYNVDGSGELRMKAVHFLLAELASSDGDLPVVFLADVTSNIVDSRTGMKYVSFISSSTVGHEVKVEMTTLLEHQDLETFESELRYLVHLNPSLLTRRTIWLVDGDRGRTRAIENVLGKMAEIHLCWWHKQNNISDHFAKAIRQSGPKCWTKKSLRAELTLRGVTGLSTLRKADLLAILEAKVLAEEAELEEEVREDGCPPAAKEKDGEEVDGDSVEARRGEACENGDLVQAAGAGNEVVAIEDDEDECMVDGVELLRFTTTKQLFVYMRSGVDLEDTHARLDRVKATYSDEKLSKYIDEELRPTIKYWANSHRVWNLTFGLTTSTMQENLHWSLKSKLRGCSVMAHMFRAFLVRVLTGRAVSVERRQATVKPLKHLIRDLAVKGGRRLVNALQTCVTKSGQNRLLMEFDLEEGRKSWDIPWSEAAETIQLMNDAMLLQDGTSWLRFTYLFEGAQDQMARRRLFVVEMREVDDDHPQRPHLVLVLPSGSVACSCGEVWEWGSYG